MLSESDLIQIRRHLHQIPELALQEHKTHQFLLETVEEMNQEFLEVRNPEELPTSMMVLIRNEQSVIELILMLCRWRNKRVSHMLQRIQA